MRLIALVLSLILAALTIQAAPAMAAGQPEHNGQPAPQAFATLIPDVTVNDGVVRLGDIFQGAGADAERIVAYAPRPGGRAVFDARWLARIAQTFKLNWRPTSLADRVVVERASQVVSKSEVEDLLQQRLVEEGWDASSRALVSNRAFRLHLPITDAPGERMLSVEQLTVDPATNRFSALVAWGGGADETMRLAGMVVRMADVPVLSNRVMRGDVIRESDISWRSLPEGRLPRNAITDADRVIGMAAKRALQPGKPLTVNDVRRPLLVNRGETVTMELVTPTMRLTAKGRALEHGSEGDIIRISNLQTNTVIDATVTGPGRARVESAVNLAMR